jgi:hypothetical protein
MAGRIGAALGGAQIKECRELGMRARTAAGIRTKGCRSRRSVAVARSALTHAVAMTGNDHRTCPIFPADGRHCPMIWKIKRISAP